MEPAAFRAVRRLVLPLAAALAACSGGAGKPENEAKVEAALRDYQLAQNIFRGQTGAYAARLADLQYLPAGLAEASRGGAPFHGYLFSDVERSEEGSRLDPKARCGVIARPARPGRTGDKVFLLQMQGVFGSATLWTAAHDRAGPPEGRWRAPQELETVFSRAEWPAPEAAPTAGGVSGTSVAAASAPFAGAERLETLVALLQGDAGVYGIELEVADLRGPFEAAVKGFSHLAPHDAKDMGLPPPEVRPFDVDDKRERGPSAKWLKDSQWRYGESLPGSGDGVVEAWRRRMGTRDLGAGHYLTNVPLDSWIRYHWQPSRRIWSLYREGEERMGLELLVQRRFGAVKPSDAKAHELRMKRLGENLQKARLSAQRDVDVPIALRSLKAALIEGRKPDLLREAARHHIETSLSSH